MKFRVMTRKKNGEEKIRIVCVESPLRSKGMRDDGMHNLHVLWNFITTADIPSIRVTRLFVNCIRMNWYSWFQQMIVVWSGSEYFPEFFIQWNKFQKISVSLFRELCGFFLLFKKKDILVLLFVQLVMVYSFVLYVFIVIKNRLNIGISNISKGICSVQFRSHFFIGK